MMSEKKDNKTEENRNEVKKKEGSNDKMSKEKKNYKKIFYGDSSEVNSVNDYDYNDYRKQPKSKQNLKGFDDKYEDFVDYILTITHTIWEEKGIGVIYNTYSNNVTMHAGSNNITGIQSVISGTLQTLHSFPDRRLIGQEVIWSKADNDSYLSSHRIISTATNLADSNFGAATNKKVNFRTAVDCLAKNNRIYEEWLVRDNLWIVKQFGLDPHQVAMKMAAEEEKNDNFQEHFGVDEMMEGQYFPETYEARDDSVGEFMKEMVNRVYECRLFNEIKNYYSDNAVIHYICNKDLVGYDQIQGMLISLFASFPSADFSIDRITCNNRGSEDDWNVALRWRIRGLHEGRGYFGEASGKPVEILGINHYHVSEGEIVEEWMTFDGMDVLKQIYSGENDENLEEQIAKNN